jgi:putative hydrolase of the HAD superfamily
VKHIVFDFGGVLFRWRPDELLRTVLPHRAADAAQAAHWVREVFQGYGGDWAEFDRGAVTVPDLVQRIAGRTGLAPDEVQAVVDAVPDALAPVPETVTLLARLREATRAVGTRLLYLSNMPAPYADHLEAAHPFVGWFDDGVFSARVRQIKPEPAIFALAAERFGVPAETLVFLDDHGPNIDAARAAGWHGVHFRDAAQCAAALRAHGFWPAG